MTLLSLLPPQVVVVGLFLFLFPQLKEVAAEVGKLRRPTVEWRWMIPGTCLEVKKERDKRSDGKKSVKTKERRKILSL